MWLWCVGHRPGEQQGRVLHCGHLTLLPAGIRGQACEWGMAGSSRPCLLGACISMYAPGVPCSHGMPQAPTVM